MLYLALIIISIITTGLFVFENTKRRKLQEKLEAPHIELAHEKANEILKQASLKAQTIVSQAIQTEMNLTKVQQTGENTLEQATEKKFDEAFGEFTSFLNTVRDKADKTLSQQTQEVFARFEQNLSDFLIQTQQKSTQAVELEMQAARNLIDTYKRQQLDLIDEQIIQVLERTLSLVLAKKLSLQDQVDLINEALEKAKAEKFII